MCVFACRNLFPVVVRERGRQGSSILACGSYGAAAVFFFFFWGVLFFGGGGLGGFDSFSLKGNGGGCGGRSGRANVGGRFAETARA